MAVGLFPIRQRCLFVLCLAYQEEWRLMFVFTVCLRFMQLLLHKKRELICANHQFRLAAEAYQFALHVCAKHTLLCAVYSHKIVE